jgi:hypothetical protein
MSVLRSSALVFALAWLGCNDSDPPGIVALGSDYNNVRPTQPSTDGAVPGLPAVSVGSKLPRLDAGLVELDAGPMAAPVRVDAGSPYECSVDLDCAIRDVGSCCGYYPRCANVNAVFAAPACPPGQAGVCGFPAIDHCECRSGRCAGFQDSVQQLY